jgi:DNA-binding NtrC family response regulator
MDNPNTILVIEDENNLRVTLSAILQRAGFNVTSSARLNEAIQNLKERCYDLIILDLKTPDPGRVNWALEFKKMQPGTPVVLLTPLGFEEAPAPSNETGAITQLFKPFDPARIVDCAKEILKNRHPKWQ